VGRPTQKLGHCWRGLRHEGLGLLDLEFALGMLPQYNGKLGDTLVALGLLNGWYRRVYYSFDLILTALYSTPAIVLLPLFIIVLGPGLPSQITIVFLTGFFPIIFTTSSGVRAIDRQLIRAGRSLGANDLEIFRDVAIPGSVPYILSGLRVGIGRSIVGLLFSEWFGGSRGIGYLVGLYGQTFQTARLLALIVIVILLSLVLVEGLKQIESRYLQRVGTQDAR